MNFSDVILQQLPALEATALLESLEEQRTHCLVLDPKKMSDEEFLKRFPLVERHPFVPHAFYYSPEDYEFGKSFLYDVGCFSIQDASAMMVPFLLQPRKGDKVLDLCAAPGGKTILASLLMENEGVIVSNDLSFPRAKTLSSAIERMGRGNVIVTSNDFSEVYGHYKESFDKIILDAPCSGSAMFRKNEQAKEEWSLAKSLKFAKVQRELLDYCAFMLKPGGTLIYSTCSFVKEENEDVALAFLKDHDEFEALLPPVDSPSFYHSPLLKEGIHFFPHRFKGEGQYAILLHKKGEHRPSSYPSSQGTKDKKLRSFLEECHLENRENFAIRESFYSLSEPFPYKKLNVLRAGVKICELGNFLLPDHALARFLEASSSLPLEEKETRAYLRGETFPLKGSDGYHVVSYQGLCLGYVKIVKGIAKNHYPKGLRHDYKDLNSSL